MVCQQLFCKSNASTRMQGCKNKLELDFAWICKTFLNFHVFVAGCVLIWDLNFSFIFVFSWVFWCFASLLMQNDFCSSYVVLMFHAPYCVPLLLFFLLFSSYCSYTILPFDVFSPHFALGSNNFTFLFLHLHLCSYAFTLLQVWTTSCFMFLLTYSTPFWVVTLSQPMFQFF
jgi:hypothetical protein